MLQHSSNARGMSVGTHPRFGFTLIELLVVVSIIGLLAALVMPSITAVNQQGALADCANNLRNVYAYAMLYAQKSKTRAYPLGSEKSPPAHASLNKLVEYFPGDLVPEIFVCAASDAVEAESNQGEFVLDEDSSSYAWIERRTRATTRRRPLASDKYLDDYEDENGKHAGHREGLQVLLTDGSVSIWARSELNPDTLLPDGLIR